MSLAIPVDEGSAPVEYVDADTGEIVDHSGVYVPGDAELPAFGL